MSIRVTLQSIMVVGLFTAGASLMLVAGRISSDVDETPLLLLHRQAVLSQRAAREAQNFAETVDRSALDDLRATMQMFSATQIALRIGGRAPLDREGSMTELRGTADKALLASLEQLSEAWEGMTGSIESLIRFARERRDALVELERVSPRLLRKVDEMTELMTRNRVGTLQTRAMAARSAVWAQAAARKAMAYHAMPEAERERELDGAVLRFSRAYEQLREGGNLDASMGLGVGRISALAGTSISGKLDEVEWLWIDHVDAIERLKEAEAALQIPLSELTSESPEVLAAVDQAVSRSRAVEAQRRRSEAIGGVVVAAVGLAGMLLGLLYVLWIGQVLGRLQRTAARVSVGGSDEPIKVDGPAELTDLARSFERMRVSLQKALHLLERDRRSGSIDLP
ncbi:MAG: HAMP domain-containing protein [Myxococcota bacterium]